MKKRWLAMLLVAVLLAYAFPAFAKYDPPSVYDIRIRSRSSRIPCLMHVAKEYVRTSINYISLDDPITLSMIDTSPSMRGKGVAANYMLSNKSRYTTVDFVNCVFESGAKVQASPTITIMENGTEME